MHAEQTCPSWRIPEGLWARMEPFLPKYRSSPWADGRALELRKDDGRHLLRPANRLPMESCARRVRVGEYITSVFPGVDSAAVFRKLWKYLLRRYDQLRGIQWQWQSLDGSTTKAPLGGEKNREKPDGSG